MKKWWGIRHVRWLYKNYCFNKWWYAEGIYYGLTPNKSDLKYLDNIWKGKE